MEYDSRSTYVTVCVLLLRLCTDTPSIQAEVSKCEVSDAARC